MIASLAGVIVWFGLAFGTKSWIRQWIAALVVGFVMAWWRYPAMEEEADMTGIPAMSFALLAAIMIVGMLLFASAGMGFYRLVQKRRGTS